MANKFCTKCGSAIIEGKKFCTQCGQPIVRTSVGAIDSISVCRIFTKGYVRTGIDSSG